MSEGKDSISFQVSLGLLAAVVALTGILLKVFQLLSQRRRRSVREYIARLREESTTTEKSPKELEDRKRYVLDSIIITKYQPNSNEESEVLPPLPTTSTQISDGESHEDDNADQVEDTNAGSKLKEFRCQVRKSAAKMRQRVRSLRVKVFKNAATNAEEANEEPDEEAKENKRLPGVYSSDTCCICLEKYVENDLICYSKGDCGHEYHLECITEWLMRHDDCPTCRSPFFEPETKPDVEEGGRSSFWVEFRQRFQ